MGFKVGGSIDISKNPIHETMAIASFIKSKLFGSFPPGTTYNNLNLKQWEYFRGIVWNDDPSCLLFDDSTTTNHDFGVGVEWYDAFKSGPANCMTQRSHFGDLQFLHSMATQTGESPAATKKKLLAWLEVMYKLACGGQGVSVNDQLRSVLPAHFGDSTTPRGSSTLKDLFLATTPKYQWSNVQLRALGHCLHVIQDSYAMGHTQRQLLNRADASRDGDGYVRFDRPGTWGKLGPVVAFHSYVGQNADRHGHYDSLNGGALPNPKDLNSFNGLLGARDAIDVCLTFINFYAAKTPWEAGVQQFLDGQVFALDPNAQPANSDVDQRLGAFTAARDEPSVPWDGFEASVDVGNMEKGLGFSSLKEWREFHPDIAVCHLKSRFVRDGWMRIVLLALLAIVACFLMTSLRVIFS